MVEKPAISTLNTRVNLDEVFGYVFENVVSEIVTPYKLIVTDLIYLIYEIDPDESVLFREEAIQAWSLIYGLINREDMPFDDVKRCVRHLDKLIRKEIRLFDLFMLKIEAKMRGESKKVYFGAPHLNKRSDREDFLHSFRNPIHVFTQKLYVAGCNLTQQEHFEMHQKIKEYISGVWPIIIHNSPSMPFEISTSKRARQWVRKQMHLLQVCPSEAVAEEILLKYVNQIERYHKDIPDVHLLLTIYYVNKNNFEQAHRSLRTFSDLSVFKPYTGLTADERAAQAEPPPSPRQQEQQKKAARLGVVDQRPFRYGPLLVARLYRIFGDLQMAKYLLQECIKEAQAAGDVVCAKMVFVEMQIIASTRIDKRGIHFDPSEAGSKIDREPTIFVCDTKGFSDKNHILDDRDAEEHHHCVDQQLDAMARMCESLEQLKTGTYALIEEGQEFQDIVLLDDKDAKARLIQEARTATLVTYLLSTGKCQQARATALAFVQSNGTDGIATHHETEAYAITEINLAYMQATIGQWDDSLSRIQTLDKKYPMSTNSKCAKHVQLAKSCIRFNNCFRLGKFDECETELLNLEKFSYEEWLLKKTLILSVKGQYDKALEILNKEYMYVRTHGADDYYNVRLHAQLATVDMLLQQKEPRIAMLEDLKRSMNVKGKSVLYVFLLRKIAALRLMAGDFVGCSEELKQIRTPNVENKLEIGLVCLLATTVSNLLGNSEDALRQSSIAETSFKEVGYPLLLKHILKESCKFHKGEELDKRLQEFCELDDEYPGYVEYLLL